MGFVRRYKINTKLIFTLLFSISLNILFSQTHENKRKNLNVFDKKAAYEKAKAIGVPVPEIGNYIQTLKYEFASAKSLNKKQQIHPPSENTYKVSETVIYLKPNQPMSVGCPNAGFEQYNFANWGGGTGTVTAGASAPIYNVTSASITNPDGNNAPLIDGNNYHTIMTLPATDPVYPNCNGYDSVACKVVGTQTVSQIPVVSPFSFDNVSARMNGVLANYRAARLKFVTTASSTNKRLTYSFALVLHDPSTSLTPHTVSTAPYFKVTVKNETTNTLLPGCTSFSFSSMNITPQDSIESSVIAVGDPTPEPVLYRKWRYYSVDLSSLAAGTNVSIEFEVGGCTNGGHFGYAYVDAECGGIGNVYGNMCSGSTFATLVAPTGFSSYQWLDPSNNPISGANNDTLIVSSAQTGDVYTVNMISPAGCSLSQTVSIALTTVNIINLNTTSSCAGGHSGTAIVQANGSNGVYNYTWTAMSGPSPGPVSYSQIATGLAPGTYSVLVASNLCGQASANLSIGVSPPTFISQVKSFCGTSAFIGNAGGTNYKWYKGSGSTAVLIAAPNGTNDTLMINNANNGDIYTLVYNTSFGCKDSLQYNLNQLTGGSANVSNLINVCPGNNDGSAVLNLNSPFLPNYNYYVYNSSGNVFANTTTSATSFTVSALAAGTYTALIKDSACIYGKTFTINTIQTTFTATASNSLVCFPDASTINLHYNNTAPTSCGIDPSLCSGGSPTQLFTAGPFTQNAFDEYPTPYGNFYTKGRHQFLIRKAELNSAGIFAGKISSLAFNVKDLNLSATTYPDFSIKMGCSSKSALPDASTTDKPFETGLVQVYYNPNQPIALGWVTHNFTQSYIWDGTSNLIVEVCFNFPGTFNFSENISIELKHMSYVANMFFVEDIDPVCGGTQLADNGASSLATPMTDGEKMLPNMKFGYCSAGTSSSDYTLSISSSNGTITTNYNNDSIVIAPTFTVAPQGNTPTIYTIMAVNPERGCIGTQTVAILYPSSQASITAVASPTSICEGSQTSLQANGALNYNWYYQSGTSQVPIANTQSVTVTPPATGTNTYIVVGSAPCASVLPDTKTVIVNVTPKAHLTITPLQDITKCMNKDFSFTTGVGSTTSGNDGKPYTYAWTTLPGNPAPGINNTSSYTSNSNTTQTLVVTVNGNCAIPISDTVVVNNFVNDLSIVITDSASGCANTPFALTSSVTGGYPDFSYNWYIYPSTTSISTNPALSYTNPDTEGNYTIIVSVNDSCGYNATDIQLINVLPPCNVIIPNVITPNSDNKNDFFKVGNIEHHPNTSVIIFDRWGRMIYENPNYNNEWKADNVEDGTYFYVIDVPDDKKYSGFITVFHGH